MKINKIFIGAFGGLKNYTLSLNDGLNVIFGENENGKSTVMAFIKMMFYGSGKKVQQLSASPRVKYAPWNGDNMCGKIYFEHNGTQYCIEREFRRSDSTDRVTLLNLDLGTSETAPCDAGIRFFGLSSAAFEKSCFISTPDISSKDGAAAGELDGKLSNLALTGDEATSYQTVASRLEGAREKLISKSGKTGSYIKKLSFAENLKEELEKAKISAKRRSELTGRADELKRRYSVLKEEYDKVKSVADREADIRNLDKIREYLAVKKELDRQISELTADDGKIADETFVKTVSFALNRYDQQKQKTDRLSEEAEQISAAIELSRGGNTENLKSESERLTAEYNEISSRKSELYDNIEHTKEHLLSSKLLIKNSKASGRIPMLLLVALGAAAAVTGIVIAILIKSFIIAGAFIGGGTAAILCGILTNRSAGRRREKLKSDYSASETRLKLLGKELEDAENRLREIEKRRIDITTTLNTDDALRSRRTEELKIKNELIKIERGKQDGMLCDLLKLFGKYRPAADENEVRRELTGLSEKAEKLKAVKQRLTYISRDIGGISYEAAEQKLKTLAFTQNDTVDFNAAREKAESLRAEITDIMTETSAVITELKTGFAAMRDPIDIARELKSAETELTAQKEFYDTAGVALTVLGESLTEVRRSYGSTLEKRAAEIFSGLTHGKYCALNISRTLDMTAEQTDVFGTRELGYLSSGTVDQAYLSLRLAISELISSDEDLPVFMDDVLSQYDDIRTADAIGFLAEHFKLRQGVLFTCHGAVCKAADAAGLMPTDFRQTEVDLATPSQN